MEAIAELIGAMVGAAIAGLLALLEFSSVLVFGLIEFLFIALTQGPAAARQQKEKKQAERAKKPADQQHVASSAHSEPGSESTDNTGRGYVALILLAVMLVLAPIVWFGNHQMKKQRQRRKQSTDRQIEKIADKYLQSCEDGKFVKQGKTDLAEEDSWGQPIQLFVNKYIAGNLIVIRSAGVDRETGTLDDQLAIRFARVHLKGIAGKAKEAVVDAVLKKSGGLKQKAKQFLERFDRKKNAESND